MSETIEMRLADVQNINNPDDICRKNVLSNSLPYVKIYPNCLVQYYEKHHLKLHASVSDYFFESNHRSLNNLNNNSADGLMSSKSSKALKIAVNWLNYLSKNQKVYCAELSRDVNFKINFITLTLPAPQVCGYCDNYGNYYNIESCESYVNDVNNCKGIFDFNYTDDFCKHELLNHFLVLLRRDFKVHNYIWRAESQKNGSIHFHITMNKFIYAKDLRDAWNKVLSKTDMIKRYSEKFKNMSYEQYKAYRYKSGKSKSKDIQKAYNFGVKTQWLQPNTTDIHAVWKIKNIAAYLCEYLTKNNSAYRKLSGFLWRSSNLLAKLKGAQSYVTNAIDDELRYLIQRLPKKIIQTDWATIFCIDIKNISYIFKNSKLVEKFSLYRQKIFDDYKKQLQFEIYESVSSV
jgi:hypothetical protein